MGLAKRSTPRTTANYPLGYDPDGASSLLEGEGETSSSITIDYDKQGDDGIYHTTDDVYHLMGTSAGDANYFRSDETLRALYVWLKAQTGALLDDDLNVVNTDPNDPDVIERASESLEEARQRYSELITEVTAMRESTLEWARKNYIAGIALAGMQVAASTLEVEVTFDDGSIETRNCRISLVDGYEQVLSERFDVLAR